jgi:acyl-coenzyme A thioesterase PaaI-like protein
MGVDESGLVHGGFTFGLADYAAMTAVNDPFVVLLSSQVKFLRPVRVGDELTARAIVAEKDGRKRKVRVEVFKAGEERVFEGEFSCLILPNHVLEK